jgi:NADP-dependent aldehyde dehydrogenase
MDQTGELLIGGAGCRGAGEAFRGYDPASGVMLDPVYASATLADVSEACALAASAFPLYRECSPEARAAFLEAIATNLEVVGDALAARARAETGLPEARVRGELGRTCGQLRLFSRVVRDGAYLDVRIDHALPQRTPPRPDLRLLQRPLGPVAIFGASNFPLAFSVAGGDTASALAAGCPVVVKAHSAHPGTSEAAGRAIQKAVRDCDLPEGVFALLFDAGVEIGQALVADARIEAVGFTGSRRGGLALMALAQQRRRPIPVYAEMSSINPVVLLPGALRQRGDAIGKAFAGALTLGAGQFCTNPGLVFALDGPDLQSFLASAQATISEASPQTMLTASIHSAYQAGVAALSANPRVARIAQGEQGEALSCQANLFAATAGEFLDDPQLAEEVFGASSLLVRCKDWQELRRALEGLEGQLTVSVHAAEEDLTLARDLMPLLERVAGRVLFNGFGTGVEVCDAMVHGGPYPATSDGRSTSVGSLAIARFLRPVCYQDVPDALLPAAVQDANPYDVPRRIDGAR